MEQTKQIGIDIDTIDEHTFPFQLENEWKEIIETKRKLIEAKVAIDEDETSLKMELQQVEKEYDQLQQNLLSDEKLKIMDKKVKEYELYEQQYLSQKEEQEHVHHWMKKRDITARNIFISTAAIAVILFICGMILDNGFLLTAAPMILIGSFFIFYLLKSSAKSFRTLIQKGTRNQPTISKEERLAYESELQEQQQLQISLQTMKHEMNQINNNILIMEQKKEVV